MFGPGDALFGTLADLARVLPILPLIGGGYTRLQPVFVEDVAEAIASILGDPGTVGRTYELAGPRVYTLRELVSMTLYLMGKRRLLVPVPFAVAKIQARLFELLSNPPLTTGQVDLSRRTMSRVGACQVSKSSRFNRNQSSTSYRLISALGRLDANQCSESDDYPPSRFPATIPAASDGTSCALLRRRH